MAALLARCAITSALCIVMSGPSGHFITMQHIAHAANKTCMAAAHVNDSAGVLSPAKGPAVSSYSVTAPSPAHASVAPTPSAATASTPVRSFLKAGAPPPPPQGLAGHPGIVHIPSNLENVRFLPAPYFPWRCDPFVSWVPRRHDACAALKLHVSACVWAAGHQHRQHRHRICSDRSSEEEERHRHCSANSNWRSCPHRCAEIDQMMCTVAKCMLAGMVEFLGFQSEGTCSVP